MRSIAVRRLGASLRRRGITGTVRALWSKVMSLPQERKAAMRRREFDDVYGVDTAEIVHLESLNIESANAIHGVRYQPSDPARFRDLVASLRISFEDFTFVDVGSGKGRALLLAAELPFRAIVGVEFSLELDEVARRNIRSLGSDAARVRTHCIDATEFEFPEDPLVTYFYNPFAEPVFARVISNLARSLASTPRAAHIILTGDKPLVPLIEAAGFSRSAALGSDSETSGVFTWQS